MPEAYPVEGYDKQADPLGYYSVFQSFDEDGSGAVDFNELKTAVEKLGMVIKEAELKKYFDEADADKGGDVDFEEFMTIIKQAATNGATTASGESFASLIERQKNAVKMSWWTERPIEGITIDSEKMTASWEGAGYGVALLDPYMPGDKKCNRGSVILEVSLEADTYVWVGLVGNNFKTADKPWWKQEFFNKDNERNPIITACRSSDGKVFVNGVESTSAKTRPFGTAGAPRIQLDIDCDTLHLEFNVMQKEASAAMESPTAIENIKAEVAVAVCFTPGKGSVRIIGSSCEKKPKKGRRTSSDMWDDESKAGVGDKQVGAVGANELLGS